MDEKKNSMSSQRKKAGKNFFQGRLFSLDFFKRNAKYIIFVVLMALAYIANKFMYQSGIQELITLKPELADAQTDLVNSSAKYNSMILESEMTKLMRERHIDLSAPMEPPYKLTEEN